MRSRCTSAGTSMTSRYAGLSREQLADAGAGAAADRPAHRPIRNGLVHQAFRSRRDAADRDRGVDGRQPDLHEADAEGIEVSRATTSSRSSRACSSTSAPRRSSWISATPCTTGGTASFTSTTAGRCSMSSRWVRTTCAACATTSRIPRSTPPRWPPTVRPRFGRSTGRRGYPPIGTRTAHGR